MTPMWWGGQAPPGRPGRYGRWACAGRRELDAGALGPAMPNPARSRRARSRRVGGLRISTVEQPLLPRRAKGLLHERVGHAIGIVVRVDDQEVDRPDVAAGDDRRPQGEHRPADELPSHLGHEQARVRQVDQLPQQCPRRRASAAGAGDRRPADERPERSISVMRAGRTWYSTPWSRPRAASDCPPGSRADCRSDGATPRLAASRASGRRATRGSTAVPNVRAGQWIKRQPCIRGASGYDTASPGGVCRWA